MLNYEFSYIIASLSKALLSSLALVSLISSNVQAGVPVPPRKPDMMAMNFNPLAYAASFLGNGAQEAQDEFIPGLTQKASRAYGNMAPLPRSDAERYANIFEAQKKGDMAEADRELTKIHDLRLLGHVLAERYLHPKSYKSSYAELKSWLAHFGDLPQAERIYRLALSRQPSGEGAGLMKPETVSSLAQLPEPTMKSARPYISAQDRTPGEARAVKALGERINGLIKQDHLGEALSLLQNAEMVRSLDSAEYDILRSEVAEAHLYNGNLDTAYTLASKSLQRSGKTVPKAAWVAGLVAWQSEQYSDAASFFERAARSPYASGWMRASSAYWAARSHMRLGNVKDVSKWLSVGMDNPRTFYGLISTRALGRDFDFNWRLPTFTAEYRNILARTAAGNRAMALVESGQTDLAQSELLRLNPKTQEERDALLAYAGYANLPGLGMRMASALSGAESHYDGALYPFGPWAPLSGYKVDMALLHAIMRQESKFDPEAESSSGAQGLMQLMPATAKRMAAGAEPELNDPEINLEIAQRYIERLMREPYIKGDLFSLMIAYNAGPGNLSKWKKRWPEVKDPLLFIELIPSSQTRAYVERVLANYWIYRMKEEKPVPTLDAVASGGSARYAQADL